MKTSIIIVNWNSKALLRQCLKSVATAATNCALEIIVVDSASFDGTGEMLANEFSHVKFLQLNQNVGFGRSNNLGFGHATGDFVLLLNPDTEVRPGAIDSLLDVLRTRPDAGLVAPRLLNTDGTIQENCVRAAPTPLNRALDSDFLRRLVPNSRLWQTERLYHSTVPFVVEAVSGACMLMPSAIFRELSGFHPAYFMYGEDMDLCLRIRQRGLTIYHVPSACVIHHGGGSSREQPSEFSTLAIRHATSTYMRLNHGRRTEISYRALQTASSLIRLGVLTPFLLSGNSARRSIAQRAFRKWKHVLRWCLKL